MKHKCSITILLSLCTMILLAQNQEVISTTGNFFENTAGSVSFTIGECLTQTFVSANLTMTQGFQQHFYITTDITDGKGYDCLIMAFPNPAKEFVIIKVEKYTGLFYVIYDINGVLLERKEIVGSESQINLENLNPSIYMLKIFNNEKEVKAFKIIKY